MNSFVFNRAVVHYQFEIDRFSTSLDRLDGYDFPSKHAQTRIKALREKLRACDENLESIKNDHQDDPDGATDRINSEYRKLIAYRMQLEILDRARSDEVPWSLVPSIENLSKRVMPNRDVLITSTPEMNYMVLWDPEDSESDITVYLPKLHRSNAFLHILIGHELFHPLVCDFIASEGKNVLTAIRDECSKILTTSLPLFDTARLDHAINTSLNAWETGLTELMCDMGAASLFGPAALWSLSAFASIYNQDHEIGGETGFYPTWRNRLNTVLRFLESHEDMKSRVAHLTDLLRDSRYKHQFDRHADAIEESLRNESLNCSNPTEPSNDPYISIAYREISNSLPKARDKICSITTGLSDRWTESLDEIPNLLGRLALNVPPSEIIISGTKKSAPANFTAILTASWIERLLLESENSLSVEKYQLLNRLTLKAIEDSEIKKQYLNWSSSK
jgi:hypothetical protein